MEFRKHYRPRFPPLRYYAPMNTDTGNAGHSIDQKSHSNPARFRYRLASSLYDGLILVAIWVFTIVTLVTVTGEAVLGPWIQSLLFIECYCFFSFFWIYQGRTLGMLAWRLKIQSPIQIGHWQALLRFIGGLVSFVPFCGIGLLWALGERRKTWSDIFSGSVIVREDRF